MPRTDSHHKNALSSIERLNNISFAVAVLAILLMVNGCDKNKLDLERASISGQVTLDGLPLQAGAVVFRCPLQDTSESEVTAFGFIENGRYKISAETGPVVGAAHVEFHPKPLERGAMEDEIERSFGKRNRSQKRNVLEIPDNYRTGLELVVSIRPGANEHDFQLDSKP